MKWTSTKHKGLRYYEHETRRHGVKKDRYFAIRFQHDGKRIEEGLGWASEGWTEQKAVLLLAELKEAARVCKGHARLAHKGEAQAKEARQAQEAKNNIPFADVAEQFLEWAKVNKKTWKDDEWRLRKHVLPRIGSMALPDIEAAEIEALKGALCEQGQAPATVRQSLALVRHVFGFAMRRNLFAGQNPVKGVKFPRVNNERVRFLSQREAHELLQAAREASSTLHDICCVSLYAGLRKSEIERLTWSDVDLEHGVIVVRDAKAGDRKAFMGDELRDLLKARKAETVGGYVFPGRRPNTYIANTSPAFKALVDSLGWNEGVQDARHKIVFHSLRHTFGSWLAQQGEPLLTIKELMGHKTIQMTMRYAHLMPDQKISAVQRLGKRLKPNVVSIDEARRSA